MASQAVITSKSASKRGRKQRLDPIQTPVTTFVILDGKKKNSRQPSEASSMVQSKAKAAELENVELAEVPLIPAYQAASTSVQPTQSRNISSITDME